MIIELLLSDYYGDDAGDNNDDADRRQIQPQTERQERMQTVSKLIRSRWAQPKPVCSSSLCSNQMRDCTPALQRRQQNSSRPRCISMLVSFEHL